MKLGNINNKFFNKIGKNMVLFATTATLALTSLVGCKKTETKDSSTTTPTTTYTTTDIPSIDTTINSGDLLHSNNYSYTKEMWDEFEENAWNSINGKINNVNRNSFKSALIILNIDFLQGNNPDIIIDYCKDGIDVETELNQLYMFVSQIREYNTNINTVDDYYSFNNLLVSSNDKNIIEVLETDAKKILNATDAEVNKLDKEETINLFNELKAFILGKGSIIVDKNDVYKTNLSKGGSIASENIMQTVSVYCQNIVTEEDRKELDDGLRMQDILTNTKELLSTYNGIASVLNSDANKEITNQIVNIIYNNRKTIYNELSKYIDIKEEEVNALYTVANIDYFMNSTSNNKVFNELYKDGFDINKTFAEAESAVEKIEIYNMSQDDVSKIYDYGHFYLDSETNIISTKAIVGMCYNLHSNDKDIVNSNVNTLKGYTQYSSLVTINYNKNGELVKLDKNALNKGGNQVINWITYYGFLNNKSNINNDTLVNDMISLVNGSIAEFDPYSEIALMVEEYCKDNNIEVYDYTVGGKVLTLK